MPQSIAQATYRPGQVVPRDPSLSRSLSIMLAPNLSFLAGTILAQLSGTPTNAVQTLTGNGVAGTFTITYNGVTSTAISGTASAAVVQAALQAMSSIGAGNVICTGGPLGTGTVVCTFGNALGYIPVATMTITNVTTTVSNAATTVGIAAGRWTAYSSAQVANPTAAPTLSDSATAGTWSTAASSTWSVAYTYVTAAGESLPSKSATIALATALHSIGIASITAIPAGVLSVNVYVNDTLAFNQAVTANATGAFTVPGPSATLAAVGAPSVSTAFALADGSTVGKAVLEFNVTTDNFGNCTFAYGSTTPENNALPLGGAPAFVIGEFRVGDLTGVDAPLLTQGTCRLMDGTSINDLEAILRFF